MEEKLSPVSEHQKLVEQYKITTADIIKYDQDNGITKLAFNLSCNAKLSIIETPVDTILLKYKEEGSSNNDVIELSYSDIDKLIKVFGDLSNFLRYRKDFNEN